MALDKTDIEHIERMISESADDIAVSISRSFERMEGGFDAEDSALYATLGNLADRIEACRKELSDSIAKVRGDTRELLSHEE